MMPQPTGTAIPLRKTQKMLAWKAVPFYNQFMNQAFHLYRLQQVDLQIDQNDSGLNEIDRLLSGNEAVNQAKQAAEIKDKELQKARQSLKEAEFAVHEQEIKISQSESNLYSGRIRTPKELQDLQKEIASLKKHLSHLEDVQLDRMVTVEELENQFQDCQKVLDQAQAKFIEQSSGWAGQREQFVRMQERLKAEREAALSLVSKESLQSYEMLRKRKNHVAVTSIQDGSCTVCGATIRPSEQQTARASQSLVFCSSCGRILYAG
jgi:predicted  nucleic acid-binding Zn-ribbon protein